MIHGKAENICLYKDTAHAQRVRRFKWRLGSLVATFFFVCWFKFFVVVNLCTKIVSFRVYWFFFRLFLEWRHGTPLRRVGVPYCQAQVFSVTVCFFLLKCTYSWIVGYFVLMRRYLNQNRCWVYNYTTGWIQTVVCLITLELVKTIPYMLLQYKRWTKYNEIQ